MVLLKQMTVLFLLMITGFICRKIGLLNDESSKKISGIVVNIANPAIILTAGMNPENTMPIIELAEIVGLAFLIYVVLLVVAFLFARIIKVKSEERGVYEAMLVFSNIAFMGFPLVSAVHGEEAVLTASMFLIPYNIFIYTYGVSAMKKKSKQNAGSGMNKTESENQNTGNGFSLLKKIFNVGVIACIITIILYVTGIPVPYVIEETADYLGSLAAPLSMLIIGDSIVKMHVKELLTDWRLIVFALFKQLALPIAGVLLLAGLGMENPLLGVCMIMLATPVGSMTVMLAQQYDGDYELASKGVVLTTILSVVTIPVVSLFV